MNSFFLPSSLFFLLYSQFSVCACLVSQSCPTFCDSMDCSPPGSSVHGDSPGKNTGVGCYALLQGIFPTQEWTLQHLNHQERPTQCMVSFKCYLPRRPWSHPILLKLYKLLRLPGILVLPCLLVYPSRCKLSFTFCDKPSLILFFSRIKCVSSRLPQYPIHTPIPSVTTLDVNCYFLYLPS